jgi:hypothetical protein
MKESAALFIGFFIGSLVFDMIVLIYYPEYSCQFSLSGGARP